jgi:hypothetical protein
MKSFVFALFLLPTLSYAQTLVAKADDGITWLIYVDTVNVGDPLQNRDRLVTALVEKRDAQGRGLHRAHQYTTGCYTHGDGVTRWGDNGHPDEWTWAGPLVLDIIATRVCQYAWTRVEPDKGIEFPVKHAVSYGGNTASTNVATRDYVGL